MSVYMIAEAGACGDGKLELMMQQITEASVAGADAVKFQWTSDARMMSRRRGSAYKDGYEDIYRRYLQWPVEWHRTLWNHCELHGVDYMCAVYLPQDIATVAPYVRHYKVSSFETNDAEFLRAHRSHISNARLIVSTGLSNDAECRAITATCDWLAPEQLVLLHCNSAYPTQLHDMHLLAIRRYADYGMRGYSDHTDPSHTMTGAYAVLAGAVYVEAHVRLSDRSVVSTDNPDVPHAMTPMQYTEYVRCTREAVNILGVPTKHLTLSASNMKRYEVQKHSAI